MAIEIEDSVGKSANGTRECANKAKDQEKIVALLNAIDVGLGGTKQRPLVAKPVQGICAPGLYVAIINFQKRQHLTLDGHFDRGKGALDRLNTLAGGSSGGGSSPAGAPGDETIPPPYSSWPQPLLETIKRSYRERNSTNFNLNDGFPGSESPKTRSLAKVIGDMGPDRMAAIRSVYDRCTAIGVIWSYVHSIRDGWKVTSSEGFFFNSKDPRGMEQVLRGSARFCADLPIGQSMHQKKEWGQHRQCYREMGVGKPGLHIGIVKPGEETADGGVHNLHIDFHQLGKLKTKKCNCWYSGLNAHFKDVGEWIVDEKAMPYIEWHLLAIGTPLPPAWKPKLRDWILQQILEESATFDFFENSIDNPPLPGKPGDEVLIQMISHALKGFRQWYIDNV